MEKPPYTTIIEPVTMDANRAGTLTILTPQEAAEYLHISRNTLMRHLWDGNIPHFKIGWRYKFIKEDLDRWRLDL